VSEKSIDSFKVIDEDLDIRRFNKKLFPKHTQEKDENEEGNNEINKMTFNPSNSFIKGVNNVGKDVSTSSTKRNAESSKNNHKEFNKDETNLNNDALDPNNRWFCDFNKETSDYLMWI